MVQFYPIDSFAKFYSDYIARSVKGLASQLERSPLD